MRRGAQVGVNVGAQIAATSYFTVAFPDWRYLLLYDAVTVQGWYVNLNRDVLANVGHDYRRDKSRMFHFGPNGLFAPGALPMDSWGT